jgi:hypothetical protein
MVATEKAEVAFEALKQQGFDLSAYVISVEQSSRGIKEVVRMAIVHLDIVSITEKEANRLRTDRRSYSREGARKVSWTRWRGVALVDARCITLRLYYCQYSYQGLAFHLCMCLR